MESRLNARKGELRAIWSGALQKAASDQYPAALGDLDRLSRFPYLFPNLDAEKGRIQALYVTSFVKEAEQSAAGQRWDAAIQAYDTALRLEAANEVGPQGSGIGPAREGSLHSFSARTECLALQELSDCL